jgi:hypothetical protein
MAPSKRPKASLSPRGGTTTVTGAGLVRKTLYFTPQEWAAIRRRSYETGEPYTGIVRRAVRRALSVPDPKKG